MIDAKPLSFTGTILVADDHEVVRYSLVRLLEQHLQPRAIVEADSFEPALEALSQGGIDLALFDLDMPGLTGARRLREVRERWPHVRIIVVTGSAKRTDVLEALDAGVHGYILKRASNADIIEQVISVLAGNIRVPPLVAELPAQEVTSLKRAEDSAPEEAEISEPITGRKRQVLEGLAAGLTNKEIARSLGVSEGTVKMHVAALFRTLNANNRAHAAALGKRYLT